MTAAVCIEKNKNCEVIIISDNANPANAGAILYSKYQNLRKVRELIKLGDLVELKENLLPVSNLGHYILTDENGHTEKRLQSDVSVSCYRDVRLINQGVIQNKRKEKRVYDKFDARLIFINEGVDFLYSFNPDKAQWTTWCIDIRTKKFGQKRIDYITLIRNLVYRDELSILTTKEREKLDYLK